MSAIEHITAASEGGYRETKTREITSGRLPRLVPAYETLLGIVIILLIGAWLPGQSWGLLNVQPHPLWVIVLVIAVRYGAFSGSMAGCLAALTYTLLMWSRPEARFQMLVFRDLIQPFLMVVVGAALGELVDGRERRNADLQARLGMVGQALQSLWQKYQDAEQTKVALERQIAFETNSTLTLARTGRKLQSLNLDDLYGAILDVVSELLEVEACALYIYQHGQLLMRAGAPEDWLARRRSLRADHPLIRRAIDERRVVTIHELLLGQDGLSSRDKAILMAGPLTLSDDEVYGVVTVESVSFGKFTPDRAGQFEMILDWASGALENALRYQQVQQMSDFDRRLFPLEADGESSRQAWQSGMALPR